MAQTLETNFWATPTRGANTVTSVNSDSKTNFQATYPTHSIVSSNPFRTSITQPTATLAHTLFTVDHVGPTPTLQSPHNPFVTSTPTNPFRVSAQFESTSGYSFNNTSYLPHHAGARPRPHVLFPPPSPIVGAVAGDPATVPTQPPYGAPYTSPPGLHEEMPYNPMAVHYKGPRPTRPNANKDLSPHALRKFLTDWDIFKKIANIPPAYYTIELYMCCSEQLQSAIHSTCPTFTSLPETDLLQLITQLITKPRNKAATRKNFQSLSQQPGEGIMDFMTRILQSAADCGYECSHCHHDLTEELARDQLMIGLASPALQKEVICKDDLLPTLADVIKYCAAFESATIDQTSIRTTPSSLSTLPDVNAVVMKKETRPKYPSSTTSTGGRPAKPSTKPGTDSQYCNGCGSKPPHADREKTCPAWGKKCLNCGVENHFRSVCKSKKDIQVAHVSWNPHTSTFTPSTPEQLQYVQTEI